MRRLRRLGALLFLAGCIPGIGCLSFLGCGTDAAAPGSPIEGTDGATVSDASTPFIDAGDAGEDTSASAPIDTPALQWAFVPFPDSRCASGTSTGIGVRRAPGSRRLVLYLEGGGSCLDAEHCWGAKEAAANTNGYDAADFAREEKLATLVMFDTRPEGPNPFRDMNMVFVPYCTGDRHGGTRVVTTAEGKQTHFTGALNLRQFLARLGPTFPDLERIYLVGTSAGGAGVTIDYALVRETFGRVRVDSIIDSAPVDLLLDGGVAPSMAALPQLWGLEAPPGCATCETDRDFLLFNRSLDPTSKLAFLSFRYDDTIAKNYALPTEAYGPAMDRWVAWLTTNDPRARTLVVQNEAAAPDHVVSTLRQTNPEAVPALDAWLSGLVTDDPSWASVTPPAP